MSEHVECVVIGAGVIGLAIGRALAAQGREVILLEAEKSIGTGTSSRNSEVIHAGIYYPPGSLKATFCVAGNKALYEYCKCKGIAHCRLGKIIAATSEDQIPELRKYASRAIANGVADLQFMTSEQVRQLEPAMQCVAGLFSPSTGIIDSHALMLGYQADLEHKSGTVILNSPVLGGALTRNGIILHVHETSFRADVVINAAGLNAQKVSRTLDGVDAETVPDQFLAKGHYFVLTGKSPFNRLIYPLPDAVGLGIHATLDLAGRARFGPDVQWVDTVDYIFDIGRRAAFCEAIRSYYPELNDTRLQPAYVGIRPKIVGSGQNSADFCIRGPASHRGFPYIALYGIESPGLTASPALADYVLQLLAR